MVPKRGQSQARFDFISPMTNPDGEHWKSVTNTTRAMDMKSKKNTAPVPATLHANLVTPKSKSGTMIEDDGDGAHERALSNYRGHGRKHR